jgi:ribulose bisphosphate carboxylase small subunit
MDADIKGALQQLNRSWKAFQHNGKSMTKKEVKKVLEYGIKKGYEITSEFLDSEIDELLKKTNNT